MPGRRRLRSVRKILDAGKERASHGLLHLGIILVISIRAEKMKQLMTTIITASLAFVLFTGCSTHKEAPADVPLPMAKEQSRTLSAVTRRSYLGSVTRYDKQAAFRDARNKLGAEVERYIAQKGGLSDAVLITKLAMEAMNRCKFTESVDTDTQSYRLNLTLDTAWIDTVLKQNDAMIGREGEERELAERFVVNAPEVEVVEQRLVGRRPR